MKKMTDNSVVVSEVTTRKDIKDFIFFPIKLLNQYKHYSPCFYSDEIKLLRGKSSYTKNNESVFFLARRNNKVVGRISIIIQKGFNQKNNVKQARFTRFDVIDDLEVSKALFARGEKWAKDKGMEEIVGPLDYSDFEREGLLIEGFDEYLTFEEQFHPSYYQKHIESLGFVKDVDWLEFQITNNPKTRAHVKKLTDAVKRFTHVRFADTNISKRKYLKLYKKKFFNLIDECYAKLYGTVPFDEKTMDDMIKNFYPLLSPRFIPMVLNEKDEVVATAIVFPSIAPIIKKSKGKLNLITIFRLFKEVKRPKAIDLGLIAVKPEYQKSGINVLFLEKMMEYLDEGVEFFETNLNLETNIPVITQWRHFHARQHKRRRCYKKPLMC